MSEFNFDIDAIADKAMTKNDKTTEILSDSSTQAGKTISFFEKLSPEQQTAILAKTPALVDSFMDNQNTLLDFGQTAVEEVNSTVNHILQEQKNYKSHRLMTCSKTPTKSSMALLKNIKKSAQQIWKRNQTCYKSSLNKAKTPYKISTLTPKISNKKWTAWLPQSSNKKTP